MYIIREGSELLMFGGSLFFISFQRIAYIGMTRLAMYEMTKELEIIPSKAPKNSPSEQALHRSPTAKDDSRSSFSTDHLHYHQFY